MLTGRGGAIYYGCQDWIACIECVRRDVCGRCWDVGCYCNIELGDGD